MEDLKKTEDLWVGNQIFLETGIAENLNKTRVELHICYENRSYEMGNEIIKAFASEHLLTGNYESYLHFVDILEDRTKKYFPLLKIYQAISMFFCEYPCAGVLKILEELEDNPRQSEFIGQITAIKAIIFSHIDNPEKGIQLSLKALKLIDPEDTFFVNLIERILGISFTLTNDLNKASFWLERLLSSSYKLKDCGGVLAAYNYLTYIRKVQGRLNEANVIYKKAIDFITIHHLEHLPHSIKIYSGFGHLLLLWHFEQEAKQNLLFAIQLASNIEPFYGHNAYQNLIEAYISEGDLPKAYSTIKKLRKLTEGKAELYERIHRQYTLALEARIFLEDGRIDQAFEWLVESGLEQYSMDELHAKFGFELGFILPLTARIYIAKGMCNKAIHIMNSAIPRFLQQGSISFMIRSLNVLAVAYYRSGQIGKSIRTIKKAVDLAKPENNFGDFLFVGKSLEMPLRSALEYGVAPDFIGQLLRIFLEYGLKSPSSCQFIQSTLLSQREMDVLRLIACGMTNREIAVKLYLSSNTIKSHSIKIYRKLDVNNRRQAIDKAQKIGLIPTKKTKTNGLQFITH